MTDDRHLTCSCESMAWSVYAGAPGRHIVCYCKDCQSFARHLDHAEVLDANDGTHIFQTIPRDVHFLRGFEHLRVLRLSETGILRWYANCCKTPVANTLTKPDWPFVGVILPPHGTGFGAVGARVFTDAANGEVAGSGFVMSGMGILWRALIALGTGKTDSPFFDANRQPVHTPQVLSIEERRAARGD
jgi:hypothetical protein